MCSVCGCLIMAVYAACSGYYMMGSAILGIGRPGMLPRRDSKFVVYVGKCR